MKVVGLLRVVTLLGIAFVLAALVCAAEPSTTNQTAANSSTKEDEALVKAFLGEVLLRESGVVVSVKRGEGGRLKAVMVSDDMGHYQVRVEPKGPFGKPTVAYNGHQTAQSVDGMYWTDFNADGEFDQRIRVERETRSVEIPIDGRWISATSGGDIITSPRKTSVGEVTFDATSGTWKPTGDR